MFAEDAAERERYYISNVLKKPQRVPVRYFFQRLEQLNGYLSHLPSSYNSQRATANTREVKSYDEAELASLALRMWINMILYRNLCSPRVCESF